MTIQPGDTIGDYVVVSLLGRGGMGRVYRVRSLLTDREEAMKVISGDLDAKPELADRFLREIRVHASLEHANIAKLNTALRIDDRIVMLMELIEGVSLEAMLQPGPIDPAVVLAFADQILSALAFAHARGVVHRDIKPANILVTPAGQVKLTDFGIARAASGNKLTITGYVLGSLAYMSPEQILSQEVDGRSDLYSLGITLYEMLTGVQPIGGTSEFALMRAQLDMLPPPPSSVRADLPAGLSEAIMRALAKDPAQRYPSAEAFRAALAEVARPAPTMTIKRTTTPPGPPPGSKTWEARTLERVTGLLAQHIGPIAKVMVNRAAKTAQSEEELYRKLAEEIPSEADRKRFFTALRST